jgi:hypothetical protein
MIRGEGECRDCHSRRIGSHWSLRPEPFTPLVGRHHLETHELIEAEDLNPIWSRPRTSPKSFPVPSPNAGSAQLLKRTEVAGYSNRA